MLTLEQKLMRFIEDELVSSALYAELAGIAPNDNYKQLLMGMSKDEEDHAQALQQFLYQLSNQHYHPQIAKPFLKSSFDDILWNRVLDETSDYRKYKYEAIRSTNEQWKMMYEIASSDENVHAMRLLYMVLR